jgi:hypothetical protein
MLRKGGLLVLTAKEYYNLSRKPAGEEGRLTRQKEIQVLLMYLEDHHFIHKSDIDWPRSRPDRTVAIFGDR